jgi:hypothetical protein
MIVDITNNMNNNILHDYNYINYKIAVLQRKLNRKMIKAQQKLKINKKINQENHQIVRCDNYQCISKINQYDEVAKTVKNQEYNEYAAFTIKRCLKNTNTLITRKTSKDYYKLKSDQRSATPYDIDMKGTCQYYLQKEINEQIEKEKQKLYNKYNNKNNIVVITQNGLLNLDCTAYVMEEGFFSTKPNLYLIVKGNTI